MNNETRKYIRIKKVRRAARVRAKITGTAEIPRLSVFRSNKFIWAQVIDDVAGKQYWRSRKKKRKPREQRPRNPEF